MAHKQTLPTAGLDAIQIHTIKSAGLPISRATAYRYLKSYLSEGEKGLKDGRQGHPSKLKTGGSENLTDGLARWTYGVWGGEFQSKVEVASGEPATFYVDGHHKAVYSEKLIPRGLVGRLGKVLGCRGLTQLHDGEGHPLLALTSTPDPRATGSGETL